MSETIVGVYDAKTRLASLIAQVEKGDHVTITRHGKPVASLVPVQEKSQESIHEAVNALRTFGKGQSLDGLSIRELIDKGRR